MWHAVCSVSELFKVTCVPRRPWLYNDGLFLACARLQWFTARTWRRLAGLGRPGALPPVASPSSPGPGGLSRGADRSGKRDAGTPGARVLRWDAQGLAAPAVKGGLLGSGRCFRFCFTGEGTEAQRGSACGHRPPGALGWRCWRRGGGAHGARGALPWRRGSSVAAPAVRRR